MDSAGAAISGYWMVLRNGAGSVMASGFTPIAFTLNNGQPYSVPAGNYGSYAFDHWTTGLQISRSVPVS